MYMLKNRIYVCGAKMYSARIKVASALKMHEKVGKLESAWVKKASDLKGVAL